MFNSNSNYIMPQLMLDGATTWNSQFESCFQPTLPLFQTVVSNHCFIFHPIALDRCFILHPIFIFHPKDFWRRRDSNLRPPNLIHDALDHRTTVSCWGLNCLPWSGCPFSVVCWANTLTKADQNKTSLWKVFRFWEKTVNQVSVWSSEFPPFYEASITFN